MTEAPEQLLGLDEKTEKPPESRLPNGQAARRLVSKLVNDDSSRNAQRALVQGLVAGNQPYNAEKRRRENRTWEANINFLGGQAMMDSTGIPYYAIFTGTEYYADCRTAYQPENPEHSQWNNKINKRFHEMLKRWPQFDREIKLASYWMRMHGIGPVIFPRVNDFRFRAIRTGNVLVPKGSPSCLDKRTKYVVVRDTFTAVELWELIKNAQDEDYLPSGWNPKCARNALMTAAKGLASKEGWQGQSWERYQQEFKNNDLGTSAECDEIAVAHIFLHEFSGKISHFIVTENELDDCCVGMTETKKDDRFLFRAVSRYETYSEAVIAFFLDTGDGTWHSVRGLADKAFRHLEHENRMMCRISDGAFIRTSLILKARTDKAKKAALLTQFGATTILGPDAEVQQMTVGTDIEAALLVNRTFGNHLANNLGVYQQRTMSREDGRGEQPTATAVNQQVLKESSLSQSQVTEFYFPLDQVVAETFHRAVKSSDPEAERFRRECLQDGVPKQALEEMDSIRFNRTSGYGSPQMRLLQNEQMMQIAGRLPEQGMANLTDDFIGATVGADKINRYNPKEQVPGINEAMAVQENGTIRQGFAPLHYSGETHLSHLEIHIADAEEMLVPVQEAVESGEADPAALEQAFGYVQLMAEHCQGHLQGLMADPARKEAAEMFKDKLNYLAGFSGKLRSAIIRAQRQAELQAEEEQQANVLGVLDQAKVASMETDIAIKTAKTEQDEKRKWVKALADKKRKDLMAQADILRKRQQSAQPKKAA